MALHLISTFVLILIAGGLRFRRTPRLHLTFMVTAFVTDLALVVYIEATRHAVEKVAARVNAMLWFHAGVSLATLVCYCVLLYLGTGILKGASASKAVHRNVGMTFVALRLLNYVTSYAI
jgi:hypothetical protein